MDKFKFGELRKSEFEENCDDDRVKYIQKIIGRK